MVNRIIILTIINFLINAFCNQTFSQNTRKKEILWTTDWSPNGKFIAVGGNIDTLKVYNKRNFKLYKSFDIKNTITRVKWHPTKNILAVTTQMSGDKSRIINLETNQKIVLDEISTEGARGVDWNNTGEFLDHQFFCHILYTGLIV